jgi:hypothetical protein
MLPASVDGPARTKLVGSGPGAALLQRQSPAQPVNASQRITDYIDELGDWRGKTLARLRKLIREAAPELVEGWKWNTPVWSHGGNVVAVSAFKDHVKVNLFKGASLADPHGLLNAGLDAKASRAIDLHDGDVINEAAFKELIRAAVALNRGKPKAKKGRGAAR